MLAPRRQECATHYSQRPSSRTISLGFMGSALWREKIKDTLEPIVRQHRGGPQDARFREMSFFLQVALAKHLRVCRQLLHALLQLRPPWLPPRGTSRDLKQLPTEPAQHLTARNGRAYGRILIPDR